MVPCSNKEKTSRYLPQETDLNIDLEILLEVTDMLLEWSRRSTMTFVLLFHISL